jgi:chorismate-pyruvate lyase
MHEVIATILKMTTSTSKLIEEISGRKLKVETIFQKEMWEEGEFQTIRMVRLFLKTSEEPLLYSISSLKNKELNNDEMTKLKAGNLPIGKLLGITDISKSNITVEIICNSKLAVRLRVKSNQFYTKKYDIFVKNKKVGTIKEIFNDESINRIWN